jgi:hypothetical protein
MVSCRQRLSRRYSAVHFYQEKRSIFQIVRVPRFSGGGGEEYVEEDAAELEVTSVDFQPGDDIQRAYFDPDCDSLKIRTTRWTCRTCFLSMDDPVRWET